MVRVPEEMRQWSAMLEAELAGWPGVTLKPMFGLVVLYNRGELFAALPRTRALGSANSVLYKMKDPRRTPDADAKKGMTPGAGWEKLEIRSAADIRAALEIFDKAYVAAGRRSRRRK
jgi:hypothetical protein